MKYEIIDLENFENQKNALLDLKNGWKKIKKKKEIFLSLLIRIELRGFHCSGVIFMIQ